MQVLAQGFMQGLLQGLGQGLPCMMNEAGVVSLFTTTHDHIT
jgi:hypothetical protein